MDMVRAHIKSCLCRLMDLVIAMTMRPNDQYPILLFLQQGQSPTLMNLPEHVVDGGNLLLIRRTHLPFACSDDGVHFEITTPHHIISVRHTLSYHETGVLSAMLYSDMLGARWAFFQLKSHLLSKVALMITFFLTVAFAHVLILLIRGRRTANPYTYLRLLNATELDHPLLGGKRSPLQWRHQVLSGMILCAEPGRRR